MSSLPSVFAIQWEASSKRQNMITSGGEEEKDGVVHTVLRVYEEVIHETQSVPEQNCEQVAPIAFKVLKK